MRYTSFQDLVIEFKFKLKRNLTKEEIDFITWIYRKQFDLSRQNRMIHNP